MSYCSSIKKGGTVNEWVDDKLNHFFLCFSAFAYIVPFRNYTAPCIRLCQQNYQESLIILPPLVHLFLSECSWRFCVHADWPRWWQWWGVGAKLFSRVAHGKVCTGARTLSVWVKAMYTFGLGTALCWVTSLHDIWLTETNACGVSVKNGTEGNVLST